MNFVPVKRMAKDHADDNRAGNKYGDATPYCWRVRIRLNREPSKRFKQDCRRRSPLEAHTYLNVQADAHNKVGTKVREEADVHGSPNRKHRMNRNKRRIPAGTRHVWKLRILDWLSKLFPVTHVCVEDIHELLSAKKWNPFSPLERTNAGN